MERPNTPKDDVAEMILYLRDVSTLKRPRLRKLDRLATFYWLAVFLLGLVAIGGGILLINWLDPNGPISKMLGW